MLVARTKAKQAASPKRAVSASGARILDRTIRPGSFVRTERVRALHEERRAAQSVSESVQQTHAAAGVLREMHDRVETLRTQNIDEAKVARIIEVRLEAARQSLGAILSRKSAEEKNVAVLVAARDKANQELAEANAVLIDIEFLTKQNSDLVLTLATQIEGLTAQLNDTREEKMLGEKERAELEKEIRDLGARSEMLNKEIDSAKQKHEKVLTDIEGAMTSFRVFERRIAKLSNETGYIIGYPKSLKR